MNPNTSATVTATGSLSTTVNNTFKSYAVAHCYLGDVWPAGLCGACVRHLLDHSSGLGNPIPIRWVHRAGVAGPDPSAFLERVLARARRAHRTPGVQAR